MYRSAHLCRCHVVVAFYILKVNKFFFKKKEEEQVVNVAADFHRRPRDLTHPPSTPLSLSHCS